MVQCVQAVLLAMYLPRMSDAPLQEMLHYS